MVKNIINILIIKLLLSNLLYSQSVNYSEDVLNRIDKSLEHKPRFTFNFNNKTSFVSNRISNFYGINLGLEYDRIFTYGISFNALYDLPYNYKFEKVDLSEKKFKFVYSSIFMEYNFEKRERFEFSIPLHLGLGWSWIKNQKQTLGVNVLYEAQLNFLYYPISYVGVGAGLGYRIILFENKHIDEQLSAPLFSIKIQVLIQEIFNNGIISKRRLRN